MRLLTVNTGSSSVRLAVFDVQDGSPTQRARQHFANTQSDPVGILRRFLTEHSIKQIALVAHRVVHGGSQLTEACRLDADVENEILRLAPLAPLHNPLALHWIEACRTVFGDAIEQVVVFDTAFYSSLPDVAKTYALPLTLCAQHSIRRYGFHGLAHEAMWRRWKAVRPDLPAGGRIISLQLGSGCSITATCNGQAIDTSMGFSPLEGLVMASRCGDIDAGLVLFLQRSTGRTLDQVEMLLQNESGLRGLAGESDMRVLLASAKPEAQLAVDIYCYRARKYIGAYLAALGGADAILFGGGVGENAPLVRSKIMTGLVWAGIALNTAANCAAVGSETRISNRLSETEIWIIPVDEAQILAQHALAVLSTPETIPAQEIT